MVQGCFRPSLPRPHPHLNMGRWGARLPAERPEERARRLDVRLVRPSSVAGHRCPRPAFAVAVIRISCHRNHSSLRRTRTSQKVTCLKIAFLSVSCDETILNLRGLCHPRGVRSITSDVQKYSTSLRDVLKHGSARATAGNRMSKMMYITPASSGALRM